MAIPYEGPSFDGLSTTGFTLDPSKPRHRNEESTVTTVNNPKPTVSPRGNA